MYDSKVDSDYNLRACHACLSSNRVLTMVGDLVDVYRKICDNSRMVSLLFSHIKNMNIFGSYYINCLVVIFRRNRLKQPLHLTIIWRRRFELGLESESIEYFLTVTKLVSKRLIIKVLPLPSTIII